MLDQLLRAIEQFVYESASDRELIGKGFYLMDNPISFSSFCSLGLLLCGASALSDDERQA